jgi:hypothetical protein
MRSSIAVTASQAIVRLRNKLLSVLSAALLALFLSSAEAPLKAQGYVSGMVFQRQGSGVVPVAGARVEVRLEGQNDAIASVETGESGRYVLSGLPAARVVVRAIHSRYYAASPAEDSGKRATTCMTPNECAAVDFEMLPAGSLDVQVVDSLGMPVEGVSLRIRPLEPNRGLLAAVRTAQDSFRTQGLLPGTYEVEAEPPRRQGVEYRGVKALVDFRHGQDRQQLRLVMPSERRYRVSGRVLGLKDVETPQMLVVLERDQDDGAELARCPRLGAPIEPSGHFAIRGVCPGSFSLRLIQGQGSELDLARSRSRPLGRLSVAGDLAGLLFSVPPDAGSP